MIKIDCKVYAEEIKSIVKNSNHTGKLIILTAGDDMASKSYVKGKIKDCHECNIEVEHIIVENPYDMEQQISKYNYDETVGGIIIQLPLPDNYDRTKLVNMIDPNKDVDGLSSQSIFKPCTPEGIMYILEKEIGDLSGKKVSLFGKGELVGKPLISMLLEKGVTLTIISSKTKNIKEYFNTDIIITAVGKHGLIPLNEVNAKIVIDAGIDYVDNHICGDCFEYSFNDKGTKVTSVPGGVGLLTRAMLIKHMIK